MDRCFNFYERKEKNLTQEELNNISEQINNLFLEYLEIKKNIINIKEEDWDLVKKCCEESNLHSSDIIHMVTAWVGGCQYLITHDKQLVCEGNKILEKEDVIDKMKVILPEDMIKILEGKLSK